MQPDDKAKKLDNENLAVRQYDHNQIEELDHEGDQPLEKVEREHEGDQQLPDEGQSPD